MPPAVDRDLPTARALVVDGNATSRSVMAAQLRDLGIGHVRQTGRIQDARVALEDAPFDIVLCELDFDGAAMSGQDLLDELRREQLLPYWTVFIVVTSEATYRRVVEAAEATVDGYLVKPYASSSLGDRIAEARRRKRTLQPVYEAIQKGQFEIAARICQQRFDQREPYWPFAGQVGAELWLRVNRPAEAEAIYQAAAQGEPTPLWAQIGLARTRVAAGDFAQARRLLEAMAQRLPGYADAHDLLARVLVEQGEFESALAEFRAAAALTPGCILRLQHCGTLAFYVGGRDESTAMLEKTIALGRNSRLFDALSLVLLALLKHDRGDARGVQYARDLLAGLRQKHPASLRLQRMDAVCAALGDLQARRIDEALVVARALAAEASGPAFDLEAATLTLSLWSRLPASEVPMKEWDQLLREIGIRYAVSRMVCDVLVASASGHRKAEEVLRACQHDVVTMAEQAMNHSLSGRPAEAVQTLLEQGQRTRNAKLIEMASMVARRHAKTIGDIEPFTQRSKQLHDEFCHPMTHIAGIRRTARTPGAVVLRT